MRTRGPVLVLLLTLALATPGESGEHLVLIGGSPKPPAALQRFLEWAGGARAHVLIVPWGSSEPAEYVAALLEDLAPHRPGPVTVAPFLPLDDAARTQLREALARATGVFFTGGDQVRIMEVLKDEELLAAFRARYRAGVVFGGTSAGTAIMSPRMITGNGALTGGPGGRPLLPLEVLQRFLRGPLHALVRILLRRLEEGFRRGVLDAPKREG